MQSELERTNAESVWKKATGAMSALKTRIRAKAKKGKEASMAEKERAKTEKVKVRAKAKMERAKVKDMPTASRSSSGTAGTLMIGVNGLKKKLLEKAHLVGGDENSAFATAGSPTIWTTEQCL